MARNNAAPLVYEICEHLGTIAPRTNGWDKELNLIVWNGSGPPKFDIRGWSPDHKHMTRGVTLYEDEMKKLVELYMGWKNLGVVKRSKEETAANEKEYWDSRKAQRDALDDRSSALEAGAAPAPQNNPETQPAAAEQVSPQPEAAQAEPVRYEPVEREEDTVAPPPESEADTAAPPPESQEVPAGMLGTEDYASTSEESAF